MSQKYFILLIILTFYSFMVIAGCSSMSKTQKGAAIGAATGATAGAFIDHHKRARGAAIGAVVGGVTGAYVGKQEDRADEFRKNNEEMQGALYQAESENQRREQELRGEISNIEAKSRRQEQEAFASSFRQVILFDTNSSLLSEGGHADVQRAAGLLNKYPDVTVLVKGYADPQGSQNHNMTLSRNRAEAVRNALIESGIEPQRIQATGHGEMEYANSSYGYQMSRRVEITVRP
jgi:outer membrane protein OmpA-like peptidoglycan-associated protein